MRKPPLPRPRQSADRCCGVEVRPMDEDLLRREHAAADLHRVRLELVQPRELVQRDAAGAAALAAADGGAAGTTTPGASGMSSARVIAVT